MIPSFEISLGAPILHGLVTIGKFDGKHPSLACATGSDNILIHSPHLHDIDTKQEVRQFSVNRRISAITSGPWSLNSVETTNSEEMSKLSAQAQEQLQIAEDVEIDINAGGQAIRRKQTRHALLIGTQTNLLCYDVEGNSDLFYKEVPEGLNVIAFGKIPSHSQPLAIVGGNCSLQGFDQEGNEMFWTVAGDNVTALCFRRKQLIVGSEDYEIRIFEGEDVVMETTESNVIMNLVGIKEDFFGFALANGTIGVYNDAKRVWNARAKYDVMDMTVFDLDDDGQPELITGWSNGRLEVRKFDDGQLVFKERFSSAVSGLCVADYRMQGASEVICCIESGEIRGYGTANTAEEKEIIQKAVDTRKLDALKAKKMALQMEKSGYENNLEAFKSKESTPGLVPQDTKLEMLLEEDKHNKGMHVVLSSSSVGTVVKLAIVECSGSAAQSSQVFKLAKPQKDISIPLAKEQFGQEFSLQIKAIVGHKSSFQDHVFEERYSIPQFCYYVYEETGIVPEGHVTFDTDERSKSLITWLACAFGTEIKTKSGDIELHFRDSYSNSPLTFKFIEGDTEKTGKISICTDDMTVAGDLVQAIAESFNMSNLQSVAYFPTEMKEFQTTLNLVEECNATRLRMQADVADNSNLIKGFVIKAEDARLLNNMTMVKSMYAKLFELNQDLIDEYKKRANNHAELLKHLKVVNVMIQKAAKLRTGKFKTQVVQESRKAIKAKNIHTLIDIFRQGSAAVPT